MHVTGEADGPPLKVGAAVVDLVCGLLAANGIQAALLERARTGEGRHVEVSLMDSVLTALLNQGSAWVSGGVAPSRRGNRHPSIVPYETYEAADRPFAVAVGNDRLFARLCDAVGLGELASDERFATNAARVEHADALAERLNAVFAAEPVDHWIEVLRGASVPVGPINGVDEAFALAAELGLEPVEEHGGAAAHPPAAVARRRAPADPPPAARARRARRRDPRLAFWLSLGRGSCAGERQRRWVGWARVYFVTRSWAASASVTKCTPEEPNVTLTDAAGASVTNAPSPPPPSAVDVTPGPLPRPGGN